MKKIMKEPPKTLIIQLIINDGNDIYIILPIFLITMMLFIVQYKQDWNYTRLCLDIQNFTKYSRKIQILHPSSFKISENTYLNVKDSTYL